MSNGPFVLRGSSIASLISKFKVRLTLAGHWLDHVSEHSLEQEKEVPEKLIVTLDGQNPLDVKQKALLEQGGVAGHSLDELPLVHICHGPRL